MSFLLYIEDGYVDQNYFERIVDSGIISSSSPDSDSEIIAVSTLTVTAERILSDERYYAEGYIASNYFVVTRQAELTAFSNASLTCDLIDIGNYFDNGYVALAYFGSTQFAEANLSMFNSVSIETIENISDYFDNGYIADGYIIEENIVEFTADVTANFTVAFDVTKILQANATFNSSVDATADIDKILNADATLDTTANITGTGVKTVEATANFGALFSPNIIVGVIKVIDATLDSSADLSATISKFTGNEATLSNIVNLSLQGAKTTGYNASFSSAFSQTSAINFTASTDATLSAQTTLSIETGFIINPSSDNETYTLSSEFTTAITPRVLVRDTSVTNTDTSQDLIYFDSATKKFGSHSLHVGWDSDTPPTPRTRVIYNGSNFYVFDNGSTWSSSNGTTWTRSSNNLNAIVASNEDHIDYLNNQFVLRNAEKLYFSSNGTSWTSIDLGSYSSYNLSQEYWIAWDGTYWYVPIRIGTGASQIRMLRTTDLTEPLADFDLYFNDTPDSGYEVIFWTGVTHNGNTPAFSYEERSTFNNGYNYRKRIYIVGSVSSPYFISTDVYRASQSNQPLKYINGKYTLIAQDGSDNNGWKIYTSSNGSSWTSSTYGSNAPEWVDYHNGYYIVGTNYQILTGTTISNITNRSVPKLINSNSIYAYPGAGDGSRYVVNTKNYGQIIETTNQTSFTAQDPLPSSELSPFVSISRGDNSDFDSWKTIDFWVYVTNNYNTLNIIQRKDLSGTNEIYNWRIACQDDDLVIQGGANFYSSSVSFTRNQWNHVRIIQDSSTLSAWVNGSKGIDQQTFSTGSSSYPIVIDSINQATDYKHIDELLVSDDLLSNHSDTTITVPTEPWQNGINTDLLMHFDNDFTDDSRFSSTVDPEVDITAVTSITASIGGSFKGDASVSSSFSQTADVDALLGADATLSIQATFTATATRIQQGASSTSSAVTVSVDAVKTTGVNSTQLSEFTTQIDGGAIRNAVGDFDSIATQLTAASKVGDFFINADSQFATTATAVKTTDIDDVLSSSFALTASETTLFKAFDSSVSSAFTTSVTATKTTDVDSTQTSAFAQTANGDRIRFGVSSVTANANLVVETAPLRNAEADLSSSFVQPNTTVLRIKQLEASVDSVLTVSADAIKAVSASGTASSAFTQSTDVNRTRDVDADFDSVATQLTAVAKIGDFLIDADVQANLTAIALKTTGNVIAMDTQFVITAIPGAIRQGASTQSSAFTVEAEGTSNITGEGELDSAITVSANAIKTIEASASFGGAGGFVVAAVATRNNEIIAGISSTVNADVKRIRSADATLLTAITTQITAGKRVEVASSINSSVTISATVRVVNIDDIVYTIPAETREYSIVAETREYTVVAETREYTVT